MQYSFLNMSSTTLCKTAVPPSTELMVGVIVGVTAVLWAHFHFHSVNLDCTTHKVNVCVSPVSLMFMTSPGVLMTSESFLFWDQGLARLAVRRTSCCYEWRSRRSCQRHAVVQVTVILRPRSSEQYRECPIRPVSPINKTPAQLLIHKAIS